MLSLYNSRNENLPNGVFKNFTTLFLGSVALKEFISSTYSPTDCTVSTAFDTNVNLPRDERHQTGERRDRDD